MRTQIKSLRKLQNLTQEQLADKLDVSRKAVSAYETGKALPNARHLVKMAEILNVSPNDLLCSKGEEQNNDSK